MALKANKHTIVSYIPFATDKPTPNTMASNTQTPPQPSASNNSPTSPSLIYVLGAPGAGKGTLCTLLAKTYKNIHHISLGDHLRSLLSPATLLTASPETFGGLDYADFSARMQRRELLPATNIVAITRKAIENLVESIPSDKRRIKQIILIDGFPRSPESAQLADLTLGRPDKVLFFGCPREIAQERFLKRRRSVDDELEVFKTRCDEFERLNGEILGLYGDAVFRVGTEKGVQETWGTLRGIVGGIFEGMELVEV